MSIEIVITMLAILVAIPYGELTLHKYILRRLALKKSDQETADAVTNEGLLAAGIVGAALWLLLATMAGNSHSDLVELVTVGLLAIGAAGAIWLYVRIRFGGRG